MKYIIFALVFSIYVPRILNKQDPKNTTKLPPCNEDKLLLYLADIQVVTPENIINLCTKNKLTSLCQKLSKDLHKMDLYLKTCQPPQQKDLYMQLFHGVSSLHKKLCKNKSFQKHFQKYQQCYHDLHKDFRCCLGPADWNESSDNDKVCRAYQDIVNCYYLKSAKLCSEKAADLLKDLIVSIINSILTIKCDVSKTPTVKDSMPQKTNKTTNGTCASRIHYLYYLMIIMWNIFL